MEINRMGNYFEDFIIGEEMTHCFFKTIFESDNNLFCLLTMNPHPLHISTDYAQRQQYGRILVPGTLVFSLVVGLTVSDISGKAIVNLDYDNIRHLAPVFIGDTLYAKSKVLDKRESAGKKDRGIIYVETIGFNQSGVEVILLRRHVLVKKAEAGKGIE